jgi:hypothetical protein
MSVNQRREGLHERQKADDEETGGLRHGRMLGPKLAIIVGRLAARKRCFAISSGIPVRSRTVVSGFRICYHLYSKSP